MILALSSSSFFSAAVHGDRHQRGPVLLLLDCDIFLITASRIVRVCHCNPPLIQKFPDISCRGFPFFETKVFCYFLCASWNITETNDSLKYQPFLVTHVGSDLGSDLGSRLGISTQVKSVERYSDHYGVVLEFKNFLPV